MTGKILFLNRLGEVQRTIALQGTREWMWDLDWSPVHARLLIVADDDQHRPTIWTIRPDGSEQVKVFTGETEILAATLGAIRERHLLLHPCQPDGLVVQGLPRRQSHGSSRRADAAPHRPRVRRRLRHFGRREEARLRTGAVFLKSLACGNR